MKNFVLFIWLMIVVVPAWAQSRKLDIYLVRHAKVNIDRPTVMGSKKAAELVKAYNSAPIYDFDPAPVRGLIEAEHPKVVTSALPRAIDTACRLFPDDSITGYSVFNEYQLGIVRIPLIPMPYPVWTGFSRLMWLVHLNSEAESRPETKARLQAATNLLEELARQNSTVVLVGHGYLISEMRRELAKRGWQIIRNGGNNNLAVSHLERTEAPN
ncbi:histidine phosphatase family protein [Mangrovibacterium diazotrophicum]|nr:histidine phosphatase family protein [Mangrovibacterium diazotrophicum]